MSAEAPARATSCEITLQNPSRYSEAGASLLRPWVTPLVAELAPQAASFVVRFTSDREMRELNRLYRGKDKPTDVLSFPGDAGVTELPLEGAHLGDIVIAVPTARRQAGDLGHDLGRELKVLVLHGLLHCLGHDHETDDGTMERLEARLRARWIDSDDAPPRGDRAGAGGAAPC